MSSITVTDITVAKTPVFYLNLRDPRDVALLHSPQTSAAATPASPTSPVGSPSPSTGLKTRDGIWIASVMKPAPTTNHGPSSSTSSAGSAGSLPGSFPAAPSTPTPTTNTGGLPLGPSPTHSLLLSSLETSRNPFFHRACAYSAERDEVLTTSDLLTPTSQSQLPIILISRVSLRRAHGSSTKGAAGGGSGSKAAAGTSLSADESPPVTTVEWMKLRPPREMPMPADAVPYRRGILYCAQGAAVDPGQPFGVLQSTLAPLISAAAPSATPTSRAAVDASAAPASTSPSTGPSGGLFYMPHGQPPRPLVTSFYGRSFNSPRSAAVAPPGPLEGPAGAIYFTDPAWAYEHEFRPAPILPQHVYRLDPATGAVRVVADGFERPDGIAVAAAADGQGEQVVYVGDGGAGRPGDLGGPSKPATIYAFDVINRGGGPFLANKRVFAYVLAGVPQCIRCDAHGNVWAACGDGIEVWNPGGDLIGLIAVPGGVSSFCLGRDGELFVCAEQRLWRFSLGVPGESAMDAKK